MQATDNFLSTAGPIHGATATISNARTKPQNVTGVQNRRPVAEPAAGADTSARRLETGCPSRAGPGVPMDRPAGKTPGPRCPARGPGAPSCTRGAPLGAPGPLCVQASEGAQVRCGQTARRAHTASLRSTVVLGFVCPATPQVEGRPPGPRTGPPERDLMWREVPQGQGGLDPTGLGCTGIGEAGTGTHTGRAARAGEAGAAVSCRPGCRGCPKLGWGWDSSPRTAPRLGPAPTRRPLLPDSGRAEGTGFSCAHVPGGVPGGVFVSVTSSKLMQELQEIIFLQLLEAS